MIPRKDDTHPHRLVAFVPVLAAAGFGAAAWLQSHEGNMPLLAASLFVAIFATVFGSVFGVAIAFRRRAPQWLALPAANVLLALAYLFGFVLRPH